MPAVDVSVQDAHTGKLKKHTQENGWIVMFRAIQHMCELFVQGVVSLEMEERFVQQSDKQSEPRIRDTYGV